MFALEILSIGEKVAFYSIREPVDGLKLQTMDFIDRFEGTEYEEELQDLSQLIFKRIGNKSGAREFWFNRLEAAATALPPSKKGRVIGELKLDEVAFKLLNSKLRLYCLRLSDSVVILFNGGLKQTKGKAYEDPGVSIYFRDANRYSKQIYKAIRENDICIKHKSVVGFDGENNNLIL